MDLCYVWVHATTGKVALTTMRAGPGGSDWELAYVGGYESAHEIARQLSGWAPR